MVMVSFCWKINFLPSKIKKQIRFIDDVLEFNDQIRCILSGPPCITSVASFLVLGGGGGARPPNVPTEKKVTYFYARASEASERLRNIYFQVSKYICTYTMQFPFITYGIALYI